MSVNPMPDDDRAARLEERLTKAQREALTSDGFTPADDLARDRPGVARQLHALGLIFVDWSPAGYALRARLLTPDQPAPAKGSGR